MSGSRVIGGLPSLRPTVAPPAGSNSLAAADTTLTVSPIDLDRDGEYDITIYAVNNTASQVLMSLFFNADTTATNYYRQAFGYAHTTVGGGRANDGFIGILPASGHSLFHYKLVKKNGRVFLTGLGHEGFGSALEQRFNIQQWQTLSTNPVSITLSSSVTTGFGIGTQMVVNFRPNYETAIQRGTVFNVEYVEDQGSRTLTGSYTYGAGALVRSSLAEYSQLALAYTPQYGNSLIRYKANIGNVVCNAQLTTVFALYQDAETTPKQVYVEVMDGNEHNQPLTFEYIMPAQSTTARTYRLFVGTNTGGSIKTNQQFSGTGLINAAAFAQASAEEIKR